MTEAPVEFRDVTYTLPDGRTLLEAISLTLAPGTTTALLGRSGSGKTTLMRTVNALITPTSGQVLVAEKTHHHLEPPRTPPRHRLRHPGLRPLPPLDRRAQHRPRPRTH